MPQSCAVDRNLTAVQFDQAFTQCHSQAQSTAAAVEAAIGLAKWLKHRVDCTSIHADARVADFDLDPVMRDCGGDMQRTTAVGKLGRVV